MWRRGLTAVLLNYALRWIPAKAGIHRRDGSGRSLSSGRPKAGPAGRGDEKEQNHQPARLLDRDEYRMPDLAFDMLRQVALPGRILDQDYLTRPDDPAFAVAGGYFDAGVEVDDVLAARCRVPVDVVLGLGLAKNDTGGRQAFGQFGAAPLFDPFDLDVAEMRLAAGVGVEVVYAHDRARRKALAPGWLDHFIYNEHYSTDDAFVYALADAMRDKYRAIVDAGFILQIDDPGIATSWDMMKPEPSLADYRKYVTLRIEALNHALAGIPPEKVRYHWCWGSWHGAHVNDIALEHIIDIALKVKAQTYSFEAGNARHQHEIGVWKEVKLAPGTIL